VLASRSDEPNSPPCASKVAALNQTSLSIALTKRMLMRCPFCSHEETQVVETRVPTKAMVCAGGGAATARQALHDLRTRARSRLPSSVKKDGTRADFDPRKIRRVDVVARASFLSASSNRRGAVAHSRQAAEPRHSRVAATRLGDC